MYNCIYQNQHSELHFSIEITNDNNSGIFLFLQSAAWKLDFIRNQNKLKD